MIRKLVSATLILMMGYAVFYIFSNIDSLESPTNPYVNGGIIHIDDLSENDRNQMLDDYFKNNE